MTSLRQRDVKHHVPLPHSPFPPRPSAASRRAARAAAPEALGGSGVGAEPLPLGWGGSGEEAGLWMCEASVLFPRGVLWGEHGFPPMPAGASNPAPLGTRSSRPVLALSFPVAFLVSPSCSSRDFSPFFREAHRIVRVGRDLWRSSSPAPLPRQGHLEEVAQERIQEDTMQNLRQMQRQMRLLDMRLHLLREKLCSCRLHRLAHHRCCLHLPDCRCLGRRALAARLDMERRMDRLRRISMMLNSCRSQSHLALVDVKGFDPSDVSVIVRDGRVTVSAEHKEEHNTALGKTCNYRKFMKEFSLPPGVDEDEVTYSVESNSLMKIEAAPKCCPHLCDF
ncbi:outer dense fiber protein 1 [Corvus moneduloides]|uniref:outer dense fiber protein 1 n=1 Tax=Corvus moneduloides TaxID=1196302 RepID=UPI001362B92E|nr:outer dense fiber protein 1 [Corvus moneduloides]